MKYALFKTGPGYTGVNVRKTPGGHIVGTLRPNVMFYLTGEEVKHSIVWVKGYYTTHIDNKGPVKVTGWVSKTWLTDPRGEPEPASVEPGPVFPPPTVEIPTRYDNDYFRSWPEAFWQGLIWVLLALVALFSFSCSYDIFPFNS